LRSRRNGNSDVAVRKPLATVRRAAKIDKDLVAQRQSLPSKCSVREHSKHATPEKYALAGALPQMAPRNVKW
jgi:hypothetical protein